MGEIVICKGKNITTDISVVLKMLHCTKDNPNYEEICDIYEEQTPIVLDIIRPRGAFTEGKLKEKGANSDLPIGRDIIYSIITLGDEIVDYITKTSKEDILVGMVVDYMADSALFSFGQELAESMIGYCKARGLGIRQGYEAPNLISMLTQKDACEALEAEKNLGVTLTDGYMLRPLKSNGTLYTITDDPAKFNLKHDCGSCPNKDCPMRMK
ncbi:MAG: hypothetical protein K6F99_07810 [Lachnospiraceae bacterium]|nr:hypothetical protein [Lachnospiraceae bacterium]